MRLVKIVYYTSGVYDGVSFIMELNRNTLSILGILENTLQVEYYYVYDLGTMHEVAPSIYGWGGLSKWRYTGDK